MKGKQLILKIYAQRNWLFKTELIRTLIERRQWYIFWIWTPAARHWRHFSEPRTHATRIFKVIPLKGNTLLSFSFLKHSLPLDSCWMTDLLLKPGRWWTSDEEEHHHDHWEWAAAVQWPLPSPLHSRSSSVGVNNVRTDAQTISSF